jgi:hypothetical protein
MPTEHRALQDQLDSLAYGDVMPLLLVTDVSHQEDVVVEVSLLDPATASGSGHAALPLFSRRFPYPQGVDVFDEVPRMRQETVKAFGERFRRLLAHESDGV